ncbi:MULTISPECIES: hypothetical protein [unclassified Acinetobacter]|uniref:hypothetical protein n=1 Tax=unclassified Acinetobacter TaxID=196816 RepID=UPI00257675E9|nr:MULTISPECIES: hypothetical protein [unclassified Acinetobacter]MDM1764051.1 hypothetical protein [Acinetobacter sp. 226-1]MDM1768982.1 hypothetical protein [Acinetobacter sp. 226-4]
MKKTKHHFTVKVLFLKLQVNHSQIKKCLTIAPFYPLAFYYLLTNLALLIQTQFALETFGMFIMLLPFVVGALIFYFILIYAFIYAIQLFLHKYLFINFWTILFSAILLSATFILLGIKVLHLELNDLYYLYLFSVPTAIGYWFLLLKEHHKNTHA